MSYYVETRWGGAEDNPSKERMRELLAELDVSDPEHANTFLTHESGWTLSVYDDGFIVWENAEENAAPRYQPPVPREKALDLWLHLSRGDLAVIEQEPWLPGYGPPISSEELAARQRKADEGILSFDRAFYDSLGPERSDIPCRNSECARGAVQLSLWCRPHHFEAVRGRPSPFSH